MQQFNIGIRDCWFKSTNGLHKGLGNYEDAVALALGQYATAVGCDSQGCGTAVFMFGSQSNLISARIEVSWIGIRTAGYGIWAYGTNHVIDNNRCRGCDNGANGVIRTEQAVHSVSFNTVDLSGTGTGIVTVGAVGRATDSLAV